MKHKNLRIIALLLFSIGLMTEIQSQNLYVMGKDTTQTAFALSSIQKLSFSSGNIIINETDANISTYALSDIRYINFRDLTTGIFLAEQKKPVDLKVFPNPVNDLLNIQINTSENQNGILEIFTLDGRLVLINKLQPEKDVHQINVSELKRGMYIGRIKNMQTNNTFRFIKN